MKEKKDISRSFSFMYFYGKPYYYLLENIDILFKISYILYDLYNISNIIYKIPNKQYKISDIVYQISY